MKVLALVPVLILLIETPAIAEDSAWLGTWKLDPSKSHLAGETIAFHRSKNGMFRFTDNSTFTEDFYIDGREYRSAFDRTKIWRAVGDRAWDVETKMGGKLFETRHYQLSPDEGALTVTATGTKPDGTEFKNLTELKRITGSKGLVGQWRTTELELSTPYFLVLSSPTTGVLNWNVLADKQTFEGKPDGAPYPVSGPSVPKGLTMSFRYDSATEISYVFRINGKPETYGLQTLAADGRSFSDVYWHPGKKSEKSSEIYVKQ